MELRRPPAYPVKWRAFRNGSVGVVDVTVEAQLWYEARAKAAALLPGDGEVIVKPVLDCFSLA